MYVHVYIYIYMYTSSSFLLCDLSLISVAIHIMYFACTNQLPSLGVRPLWVHKSGNCALGCPSERSAIGELYILCVFHSLNNVSVEGPYVFL